MIFGVEPPDRATVKRSWVSMAVRAARWNSSATPRLMAVSSGKTLTSAWTREMVRMVAILLRGRLQFQKERIAHCSLLIAHCSLGIGGQKGRKGRNEQ